MFVSLWEETPHPPQKNKKIKKMTHFIYFERISKHMQTCRLRFNFSETSRHFLEIFLIVTHLLDWNAVNLIYRRQKKNMALQQKEQKLLATGESKLDTNSHPIDSVTCGHPQIIKLLSINHPKTQKNCCGSFASAKEKP